MKNKLIIATVCPQMTGAQALIIQDGSKLV